MYDFLKNLWLESPILVVLVVMGYFLKLTIEKRIETYGDRLTEIAKTSLALKQGLRNEERKCLVRFRVALEKWEDFLLNGLADYFSQAPSQAQVESLAARDQALFLELKVQTVKACVYLRDEALELRLRGSIIAIRKLYYPIIMSVLPRLVQCQIELAPLQAKLNRFAESGCHDTASAPTEIDRANWNRLQTAATEALREFSERLTSQYRPIAEQLDSLKSAINQYIYRPIDSASVDRD